MFMYISDVDLYQLDEDQDTDSWSNSWKYKNFLKLYSSIKILMLQKRIYHALYEVIFKL